MRARAKMLRWEEESILIPSEMKWTMFFFHNRANGWKTREAMSHKAGHQAYARKQVAMWTELAEHAQTAFTSCLIRYTVPPSMEDDRMHGN